MVLMLRMLFTAHKWTSWVKKFSSVQSSFSFEQNQPSDKEKEDFSSHLSIKKFFPKASTSSVRLDDSSR